MGSHVGRTPLCHNIHGNLFGGFGPCLLVQDKIRRLIWVFKPESGAACAMIIVSTCHSVFGRIVVIRM